MPPPWLPTWDQKAASVHVYARMDSHPQARMPPALIQGNIYVAETSRWALHSKGPWTRSTSNELPTNVGVPFYKACLSTLGRTLAKHGLSLCYPWPPDNPAWSLGPCNQLHLRNIDTRRVLYALYPCMPLVLHGPANIGDVTEAKQGSTTR